MTWPPVSVIVPTYQRRELVRRAVDSVLSQSYEDLELIVVDDGSTDGTGETLTGLDERVRYVRQENAGVAAARNHGLGLAGGGIVAFLDSDNRWLPDHIAVLVEVLERHPEAVLATTCPEFVVGGAEEAADSQLVNLWPRVFRYGRRGGYISGVAVRSEALDTVGGFDERFRAGEDSDLFTRLGLVGPFATVQRRTLIRGITPTSLRAGARRSGDYLRSSELNACNVLAAAEVMPDGAEVVREARVALHMARAFSALERSDTVALKMELEAASELWPGLAWSGVMVANRIWKHLPQAGSPAGLLAAYASMAEAWPDRRSDTARFIRALAIVMALRTARPRQLLRLLRGWPRGETVTFLRRRAPSFRMVFDIALEDRRERAQAASRTS